MLEEIAPTLGGEAVSRFINWAKAQIADRKKQAAVGRLIDETATRASIQSPNNLGRKFRDAHRVEELLAHHELMDISEEQAIRIFLGNSEDQKEYDFVHCFYDEVSRITATGEESLTDRKTLSSIEEANRGITSIQNKLEKLEEDSRAEITLLEEVVVRIEASSITVAQIKKLAGSAGNTIASSYLNAYYALCTGDKVNYKSFQELKGSNRLALALCSAAISANRIDDVEVALSLCSFDTEIIENAVRNILCEPKSESKRFEIAAPDDADINGLIGLINLEKALSLGAFQTALEFANENEIEWNPIVREKRAAASLIADCVLEAQGIKEKALRLSKRFQDWFPESLKLEYQTAISTGLSMLEDEDARLVLSALPNGLEKFAQDESKFLSLKNCRSAEEAIAIASWAEARCNPTLFLFASAKLIEINDVKRTEVIEICRRNSSWALPDSTALEFYVSKINPDITYEEYSELGRNMQDEAIFHLMAYRTFADSNPTQVIEHMEKALKLMKPPYGAPNLLHSSIWVPYLVNNGRRDEIIALVKNILPLAPLNQLRSFLSAIFQCENNGNLFEEIIDNLTNDDFKDPAAAQLLASYLYQQGETELAGRIAIRAFNKRPSDILAQMAARWQLESSLPLDKSIVRFAEETDSQEMNLLSANIEKEEGSPQRRDSYLIRAAFGSDTEAAKRALVLYATWHAQNEGTEPTAEPETVDANTYAIVKKPDGQTSTLLFFSDTYSVRENGIMGPAGIAYNTSSEIFLRLRGCHIGEKCSIDDDNVEIVKIGLAGTALSRAGFAEIPNLEGSKVIQGTPEEVLDQITNILATSNRGIELYKEGIETEAGSIYFGIETGGKLVTAKQLEFAIQAVLSPSIPFRRPTVSRSHAIDEDDTFMLSYSSIVVLSLLNLPAETIDAIKNKCVITRSTAKRIKKQAGQSINDVFTEAGRLALKEGKPIICEPDEASREEVRAKGIAIISLIDQLNNVEPSLTTSNSEIRKVLSDNQCIDIQTANDSNYVYVTEDVLEAQAIDMFKCSKRCSLSILFTCLRNPKFGLTEFVNQLARWNAKPPLEYDIAQILQSHSLSIMGSSSPDSRK